LTGGSRIGCASARAARERLTSWTCSRCTIDRGGHDIQCGWGTCVVLRRSSTPASRACCAFLSVPGCAPSGCACSSIIRLAMRGLVRCHGVVVVVVGGWNADGGKPEAGA
jgi:hypothetical protein